MTEQINMEANFLDLYLEAVGITEVPEQFHLWTALSLVAACLEDRIWVERMAYQRLFPNQYVFLIGNPACGKGTAINLGRRVLDDMERRGYGLNYYRGSSTRAGLQDELTERWEDGQQAFEEAVRQGHGGREPEGVSLLFLAPELSSNVGIGPQAKDLIKFLTDLWEGDVGKYRGRTRLHGKYEFHNPCVNALVGSAPDWCREVVDTHDLKSGFWARVACVRGERDPAKRIARPDTAKWSKLLPILSWRLALLMRGVHEDDQELRGPMHLSPEAEYADIHWYETRARPEDELFEAHWSRQPDQVLRLAMLLRLCEFWDLDQSERFPGEGWRVIGLEHWQRAVELSEGLLWNAASFLGESLSFTHNWQVARVEEVVRKRREVRQRPELLRVVSRYGIKAKELEKALQALEDEVKVERWTVGGGNFMVKWRGEA